MTLSGYELGEREQNTKKWEYQTLVDLTGNFEKKGDISGILKKEVYKKERSRVFLMKIHTFDNFDNFDKSKNSASIKSKSAVEDVKKRSQTSLFIEVPSNLSIDAGDTIRVSGKIRENIGFPLQGFSRYAFFHGGYGYLFVSNFEILEKNNSIFLRINTYWKDLYEKGFPREVAGTLLGMTVGSFSLLPTDLKESFLQSGTSHILVVSGSNIALLIVFLLFFLKYLHIQSSMRIGIIGACIIFYVGLVGADMSVIRAAIMGLLSFFAIEWGDRVSSRATIALALIIATILEPLGPLYDAGFGLSFGATLGIVIFHRPISRSTKKYNFPDWVNSTLALTLGASLGSLPILLYHFGQVALMSIFANIAISIFLGWILFSGILYGIFSVINNTITYFFGFLVYLPTRAIIEISRFFEGGWVLHLPGDIAVLCALFLLGMYSVIFLYEHD